MANITIRNLDDDIRTRLRVRAAGNGHSMEEEVRQILRIAVGRAPRSRDLASIIRSHFDTYPPGATSLRPTTCGTPRASSRMPQTCVAVASAAPNPSGRRTRLGSPVRSPRGIV